MEALRKEAQVTVKETVAMIEDALNDNRFFLLENQVFLKCLNACKQSAVVAFMAAKG